ncbi:GyrI-like domain-containing protein [Robiginitalea sediminis]|uniref:GyrI-like domain-containing protein n=1 Tax=Robiginitalea sediminis TaxID=1982593 RepID=UPI000B4C048E|nr:GyrI-like domain-containing protein [Robiginitalea sediminis]
MDHSTAMTRMDYTLQTHPETLLAGKSLRMSVALDRTGELWGRFMPGLKEIPERIGRDLYSMEVYDGLAYFDAFDPEKSYTKWAAVPVAAQGDAPEGTEYLILPEGLYAVFPYRASMAPTPVFYGRIFTEWLPKSGFRLDNRPHLAIMGPDYHRDNPDALEHIWIPVKANG